MKQYYRLKIFVFNLLTILTTFMAQSYPSSAPAECVFPDTWCCKSTIKCFTTALLTSMLVGWPKPSCECQQRKGHLPDQIGSVQDQGVDRRRAERRVEREGGGLGVGLGMSRISSASVYCILTPFPGLSPTWNNSDLCQ